MSHEELSRTQGEGRRSRLAGWKLACAIVSGVLVAPVMGLVLALALATALPFVLVSPVLAGTWVHRRTPPHHPVDRAPSNRQVAARGAA